MSRLTEMGRILKALFSWGLAVSGIAFEMASPLILFPSDQLVVIVAPDESPPSIQSFPCGLAIPVKWEKFVMNSGKIQYKAYLSGLSEGVWQVSTNKTTCTFLIISPFSSLVEVLVEVESLVTMTTVTGEVFAGVASPSDVLTFIVRACWGGTSARISSSRVSTRVILTPGNRIRVFLSDFELRVTSSEVLPGLSFILGFVTPRRAPLAEYTLTPQQYIMPTLPPGWAAEYLIVNQHIEPLGLVPVLKINVPSDAKPGKYVLQITIKSPRNPDFSCILEKEVVVTSKLSVKTVIGHWDVVTNKLDLTQPYALTYDRILWAATLIGREIPFTGVIMTQELLQSLAEEWASSAQ